jgi:hypothetical protein
VHTDTSLNSRRDFVGTFRHHDRAAIGVAVGLMPADSESCGYQFGYQPLDRRLTAKRLVRIC